MTYDRLAGTLYAGLPIRLRRAAPLLGITLADGVYLTAWPLWALLAPIVVFVFGFSVGGWHWLPQNIWDGRVTAYPAVAFMQMLPLLVIAVAVGALSAGLGLLLIVGYAIGDLFISGATYAPYFHRFSIGYWLSHVVTAQLISYLVFLLLAVLPTLAARALAVSVPGLRVSTGSAKTTLRALVAAALAGLLVYAWTYMAPMAIRPLWLWTHHSSSPVTVPYFTAVVNPLLPLLAAGFILVRALVEALARRDERMKYHAARVTIAYMATRLLRNPSGPLAWFGTVCGALVVTLLLAGLITRLWPTGIIVFAAVLTLLVAQRIALPRWGSWQAWTRLVVRVPLILRWMGAVVGAYIIGRGVLALPGLAVWQNEAAGTFGAELSAIVLGLALAAVLLPVPVRSTAGSGLSAPASARTVLQILALVGAAALALHPDPALAKCVASFCCFRDNLLAGLYIGYATLVTGILIFFSPELLGFLRLGEMVESVFESLAEVATQLGELGSEAGAELRSLVAKAMAKESKAALELENLITKAIDKKSLAWIKKALESNAAEGLKLALEVGTNEVGGLAASVGSDAFVVTDIAEAVIAAAGRDVSGLVAVGGKFVGTEIVKESIEKLPDAAKEAYEELRGGASTIADSMYRATDEIAREGASELYKGTSAIEDSIQHATSDIADLAHGPAIAPYPLGADGSRQTVELPSAGGGPACETINPPTAQTAGPDLPAHAGVQTRGISGQPSGHATGFSDVRFGSPAEPSSHYHWISDGHAISITPAGGKMPGADGRDGSVAPPHLGGDAKSGGQVWFGPDNTVTVQLDQSGNLPFTHDLGQLQAIVHLWRSLGYTVNILPPGS